MPKRRKTRQAAAPRAGRPHMPGYGILAADQGRGLLPWSWASTRLKKAHNYWVATTRPDGGPHLMAVWGLWLDDTFYFSTGGQSRKARNLAANPRCVMCTERADEAVIVEGKARRVTRAAVLPRVWAAYKKKYKWDMHGEPFYAVRPRVAFAFIEKPAQFVGTATRWLFPGR